MQGFTTLGLAADCSPAPTQSTGTTQLPGEVAEELVLSAAREAFYSATTLDSPDVTRAQQCLALLPESAAAKGEAGVISGLLRLQREHGYAMLPAAFKEVPLPSTFQSSRIGLSSNY